MAGFLRGFSKARPVLKRSPSQLANSTARFLAKVPAGEKYFAKPRHFVTRPLRTLLLPNFGTHTNRALLGIGLGSVGQQGWEAYKQTGKKLKTILDLPDGGNSQVRHLKQRWNTPKDVAFGTLAGVLPGADLDRKLVWNWFLENAINSVAQKPTWSPSSIQAVAYPARTIAMRSAAKQMTDDWNYKPRAFDAMLSAFMAGQQALNNPQTLETLRQQVKF